MLVIGPCKRDIQGANYLWSDTTSSDLSVDQGQYGQLTSTEAACRFGVGRRKSCDDVSKPSRPRRSWRASFVQSKATSGARRLIARRLAVDRFNRLLLSFYTPTGTAATCTSFLTSPTPSSAPIFATTVSRFLWPVVTPVNVTVPSLT